MTPSAPQTTSAREALLAKLAERRAALDALDAAALVDVSDEKAQIASAERTIERLLRRIEDEQRQVREARAQVASARSAIRSQLGRFVAAGAPAASVATLHDVPLAWVEPLESGAGGEGADDGDTERDEPEANEPEAAEPSAFGHTGDHYARPEHDAYTGHDVGDGEVARVA